MLDIIEGSSILITGGTGSFGKKFVEYILSKTNPRKLVVFSRDEMKQFDMSELYPERNFPCIRYFLGDVRDKERLIRATSGIDIIIHAAAMKQIVSAEYNPTECIATNILGAQNLIDAAIFNKVKKVVALSTDKAANPINLYGATKLCSDKLFVAANNLSGNQKTRFSIVRYGNVAGSRGSVIPYFKKLIKDGVTSLPITHPEMTRFIITLEQGVELVINTLNLMHGGEIFVPKLPSIKIKDLIPILGTDLSFDVVGVRPGEKIHETMIPVEEARNTVDLGEYFIVQPNHYWWNISEFKKIVEKKGKPMEIKAYSSDTNTEWLSISQLNNLVKNIKINMN